MAILLNAQGRPEPSPEVTRRLLAVDPALFLRFFDHAGAAWGVCMAWPKSDVRWAEVQAGRVDPTYAFDIVGFLPMDCPVDEAPAYLGKMLRDFPKDEVRRIADRVTAFNAAGGSTREVLEQVIGEMMDQPDPSGLTKTRRSKKT